MLFQSQAKTACEMLQAAPGLQPIMPQGSMYLMIEIKISLFSDIADDLEFIKLLYLEQSVLCIPGQVRVLQYCLDFYTLNKHQRGVNPHFKFHLINIYFFYFS